MLILHVYRNHPIIRQKQNKINNSNTKTIKNELKDTGIIEIINWETLEDLKRTRRISLKYYKSRSDLFRISSLTVSRTSISMIP